MAEFAFFLKNANSLIWFLHKHSAHIVVWSISSQVGHIMRCCSRRVDLLWMHEEPQIFVICVAMDNLTSNREPRYLAMGTGWMSESPTRILETAHINFYPCSFWKNVPVSIFFLFNTLKGTNLLRYQHGKKLGDICLYSIFTRHQAPNLTLKS